MIIGTVFKVVQQHTPGDFLKGCRMCRHPLCTRPAQHRTHFDRLAILLNEHCMCGANAYHCSFAFGRPAASLRSVRQNTRLAATEDERAVVDKRVDGDVPLKCQVAEVGSGINMSTLNLGLNDEDAISTRAISTS